MFRELLAAEFASYRILSEDQLAKLEAHYRLLVRWNQRLNLTRITKLEDVVRLHYCESLFLASQLPPGPLKIVDIGSGAGFPGIPVAIMLPDASVDLAEAHQRKAVFLREASRELSNVSVLAQRAEDLKSSWDWIISRGVRSLDLTKLSVAVSFALLIGEEDASKLPGEHLKLPWGTGRYLAKFHVKQGMETHL